MKKIPILFNKTLVIGIIILFFGAAILPSISGNNNNNQEISTIIFYTFGRTGTKKCKVELSNNIAADISNRFEELKTRITGNPHSEETESLKNDFVEILDANKLIPKGLSKDYIISLLNPRRLQRIGKYNPLAYTKVIDLKESTLRNDVLPEPLSNRGSAFLCSIAGGGSGLIFPPIMLPRPRLATLWASYSYGGVTASNIYTGHGFVAIGAQIGVALGFWGIGLSFAFPGEPSVFGFGGYALLAIVGAAEVEHYPVNNPPIISEENPPSGTWEVPVSLSELSFHIIDPDKNLMSYWVTTEPDIGSAEGHLKNDGVYSVPVSNLDYDKSYSWTVRVSDGKETVEKKYSFITKTGPPFDPFDEGWQYRKKITIDNGMIASDLSDFPVLISTTDTDLRNKAQNDGDDILFMDGSGIANKLYHEIEKYDDSSGELVAWVNIPSLSSTDDTNLYIYYGNSASQNQQLLEKVWNSNFLRVYHLNEGDSSTTVKDSTLHYKHGSKKSNNEPSQDDGIISYGQHFDNNDDNIVLPNLDADYYTIEGWFNRDSVWDDSSTSWEFLYSAGDENPDNYVMFTDLFDSSGKLNYRHNGPDNNLLTETNSWPINKWYYFSVTYDGSTKRIYINGNEENNDLYLEGRLRGGKYHLIGSYYKESGTYPIFGTFNGRIDEFRISNIARGSSWISTQYNNQNDPSSFFSVGPEESTP